MKRRIADTVLAAQLLCAKPSLMLFQYPDDLLWLKRLLFIVCLLAGKQANSKHRTFLGSRSMKL